MKRHQKQEPTPESTTEQLQQELYDATVSKQGIIADNFDEAPTLPTNVEELEALEKQDGVTVYYSFRADEVKQAMQIFQKNTIYRKNMIYSLIVLILFVLYLVQVLNNSESKFALFMCVLTVTVLLMIWYFPLSHIHTTVKAIASQENFETFRLSVYDNAILIGEGEQRNIFYYKDGQIRVWETDTLFVIGYAKQHVFVVPKRCFEEEQSQKMRALFQTGLENSYQKI